MSSPTAAFLRNNALASYTADWWEYLSSPGRFQGLDLLRAIAVSIVIVWHFDSQTFQFGWTGVDLFFVLSGFLIGSILFKSMGKGSFSFRDFYWHRILRIIPTYLLACACYVMLQNFFGTTPTAWQRFVGFLMHALFIQKFMNDNTYWLGFSFYLPTWSLVVEVLFYIIAPAAVWLVYKRARAALLPLMVMFIVIYPLVRWFIVKDYAPNDVNWHFYHFTEARYRLDQPWFGMIVAYLTQVKLIRLQKRHRAALLFVATALLGGVFFYLMFGMNNPHHYPSMAMLGRENVIIPSILAAGYAAAMLAIYDLRVSWTPITIIARLAYVIYLAHEIIFAFTHRFWLSVSGLGVVVLLVSYAVEYPFIRFYKSAKESSITRHPAVVPKILSFMTELAPPERAKLEP